MTFSANNTGGQYTHYHYQAGHFGQKHNYTNGIGYKYTDGETVVTSNEEIQTSASSSRQPYIVVYFWRRTA